MAQFLLNRKGNSFYKANNIDEADYQCFLTFRRGMPSFSANYKVKLTNSYKEVKKDSLLWKQLLKECCKKCSCG